MTQVDWPIGIGGSIVENVQFCPLFGFPNAVVQTHLLPSLQEFRLILGQIGFHRKAGFGQIDRGLQVEGHADEFSKWLIFSLYRESLEATSHRYESALRVGPYREFPIP
jgi:hypothetical protein